MLVRIYGKVTGYGVLCRRECSHATRHSLSGASASGRRTCTDTLGGLDAFFSVTSNGVFGNAVG
jgi:hypothetical protein